MPCDNICATYIVDTSAGKEVTNWKPEPPKKRKCKSSVEVVYPLLWPKWNPHSNRHLHGTISALGSRLHMVSGQSWHHPKLTEVKNNVPTSIHVEGPMGTDPHNLN